MRVGVGALLFPFALVACFVGGFVLIPLALTVRFFGLNRSALPRARLSRWLGLVRCALVSGS